MDLENYYGRRVLVSRYEVKQSGIQELPTIRIDAGNIRCYRCNHVTAKSLGALPQGEFYCPHCINLGRVSTLNKFYHVPEPNQFTVIEPVLTWKGKLSPLQQQASEKISQGMAAHVQQLLWAVTGAGKTEMMFAGIVAAIKRGERIGIASPRVDVCLELFPRLKAAFANCDIALLHGRQELPYHYAQLTICTTHQLLRFYHAFDNLIIDEVDAFPYAANASLLYATKQAIKENGGCLYLTATPGDALLREIKSKRLVVNYLPLRYHGHLLPQIKVRLAFGWRRRLERQKLPPQVIQQLQETLREGHRFLLFVPHIADLALVEAALRHSFTTFRFATVHASDPERLEKVQKMRDGDYDFLVTTSILERGVTFPEIDVYVLGADDPVFSSSALVQIAGRAGRAQSRPTGRVVFWINCNCRQVNQAISQVKYLNRKGQRLIDGVPFM
ncbi:DEAD/DEAH box helicase [Limosilactobacillus reuteri]|uniref:DEAD/DEAH box helicase n=1 Tax=Limosilactobacillus reuteri TaxID=1598 RepID=UPI001E649ECE|nr:helicase-related protein [Limosilactobacillus reuteri]MCC4331401.1 DEAD/DEAH box helicase family protein [Limosilactobacillus reuteri]MCC4353479.1 DEAD/DEAH box helicase family protein [Limosilactobacillus reuteri]MCC4357823.1 DEAD/DEAH box helicase family protein [Limosilactobacillus reuteri]MCC4362138.1 DEAD/DEAH box helicase family protein [Limosilactobacillus reuteri]MCC4364486.1 DEAD/DEAH box helicase family protein [Limosilactobacillus reuteri]